MAKQVNAEKNPFDFQYAVKFICTANIPGTSQSSDAVLPGTYQTAVNIHNPQSTSIKLRKKIASPIGISQFLETVLKPDGVDRVVCKQLNEFGLHFIHGFEGFLVIESTHSLDVVAVYTAGAIHGEVTSIEVEQIKERKL